MFRKPSSEPFGKVILPRIKSTCRSDCLAVALILAAILAVSFIIRSIFTFKAPQENNYLYPIQYRAVANQTITFIQLGNMTATASTIIYYDYSQNETFPSFFQQDSFDPLDVAKLYLVSFTWTFSVYVGSQGNYQQQRVDFLTGILECKQVPFNLAVPRDAFGNNPAPLGYKRINGDWCFGLQTSYLDFSTHEIWISVETGVPSFETFNLPDRIITFQYKSFEEYTDIPSFLFTPWNCL